jgi:hypothetical protein
MNTGKLNALRRSIIAVGAALAFGWTAAAQAHCDTLDGPVVEAARKALDTGNPNLALVWVQKRDEAEIRHAFDKATAVRKAGGEAKALADHYFFETLVRVHRAGEGAPYTGLKPAGKPEPAVAAADKSIETGKLEPVAKLVSERMHHGLHKQFHDVASKKVYNPNDVAAGRAYVDAYVEYVHHVERLYDAAGTQEAAGPQTKPAAHAH